MKIQSKILAGFLLAAIVLAASMFTGCATSAPIKTTLDLQSTETGLPQLNYSSEKDVIYARSVENADGILEVVEFKALASAAAYAQAERDKVQAEANAAQAQALAAAVQALSGDASRVLIPAARASP